MASGRGQGRPLRGGGLNKLVCALSCPAGWRLAQGLGDGCRSVLGGLGCAPHPPSPPPGGGGRPQSAQGPSELHTNGAGKVFRVLAGNEGGPSSGSPSPGLPGDSVDAGGQGLGLGVRPSWEGPQGPQATERRGRRPATAQRFPGWKPEPQSLPPPPPGCTQHRNVLDSRAPEASPGPAARGPFLNLLSTPEMVAAWGHCLHALFVEGRGDGMRLWPLRTHAGLPACSCQQWRPGRGTPRVWALLQARPLVQRPPF